MELNRILAASYYLGMPKQNSNC